MTKPRHRISPAIILFFLSPIVGELLSGSSPPAEFFTVFGFTVMTLLYGGGAVLVRELKVRWRKGMGSLLLLGAAYGVVEEGLMVASFQNPNWVDIGIFGEYGRWLGINWVWAVELTGYHSIISIAVPVILVELSFPNVKAEPWLKGRWRWILPLLFVGDVVFGYLLFPHVTGFIAPVPQYLFLIFITLGFVYLARILPNDWARRGIKPMRKPWQYGVLCFLGSVACGIVFWVLPNILVFPLGPLVVIFLGIIVLVGAIRYIVGFDWRHASDIHRFYLATGSLLVLIIFAILQEFDTSRNDNTTGMSIVGLLFLSGLFLLRRKIMNREKTKVDLVSGDSFLNG